MKDADHIRQCWWKKNKLFFHLIMRCLFCPSSFFRCISVHCFCHILLCLILLIYLDSNIRWQKLRISSRLSVIMALGWSRYARTLHKMSHMLMFRLVGSYWNANEFHGVLHFYTILIPSHSFIIRAIFWKFCNHLDRNCMCISHESTMSYGACS